MNVLLPVMYLILLLLLKSHNITDRTFSIFPFKDAPFQVHLCFFQENFKCKITISSCTIQGFMVL